MINIKGIEYQVKVWDMEFLGDEVAIDTETCITPFTETPDIVTFQAYGGGNYVYFVEKSKIALFLNKHYNSKLIAHNFPFDADVIHKATNSKMLYEWYDRSLIYDTGVLYRLLHLATVGDIPFKYSLAHCADRILNVELVKDERRENFGQFVNTNIKNIPEEYLEYAGKDAVVTFHLYNKLRDYIGTHDKYNTQLSQHIQVKGDLALLHIYKRGIGFDIKERDAWLEAKQKEMDAISLRLSDWGLIRGVVGYKSTYAFIIEKLLKIDVPFRHKKLLVEKNGDSWYYAERGIIEIEGKNIKVEEGFPIQGEPSRSSQREDLEPFYSIPFIKDFLDFMELEKATSFVRNIVAPRIHPKYTLLVNTGRTSCSGGKDACNIQQIPKIGGVRELFIPDEGKVFIDVDYSAIELATLAEVCYSYYGESYMRDRINDGQDLHKYYASVMRNCPIDKVTKQWRQEAKAANFGFPGGLGVKTFIQFSKSYGLTLTEQEASVMKETWFKAFPEMIPYMKSDLGYVYTLTGRKRNNTTYCAEKNTPFQGLASDGLKMALYDLDKKGYNVVAQIHDQILVEAPKEGSEKVMEEVRDIMEKGMQKVVPHVKIGTEGQILDRWTK